MVYDPRRGLTNITSLRTDTTLDLSQKAEKVQLKRVLVLLPRRGKLNAEVVAALGLKKCAMRESNPRLTLGKRQCYHYTNGAK